MILNCFLCASLVPNPVTDSTTNTRRITAATIAGKRARPIIKLLLYPSFFDTSVYTKAITKPITTATNIPNIDWLMLIVFSDVDVKIDSNIYFLLYPLNLCNS